MQQNAIDFVQLVDGKTYRGQEPPRELLHLRRSPARGRRRTRDGGGSARTATSPSAATRDDMDGNHVIIDIGGGRYVLYAHMKQGSLRVRAGDLVPRDRSSARSATPGTPMSRTCTSRCRTSRLSTWKRTASPPTRCSSRARRPQMSGAALRRSGGAGLAMTAVHSRVTTEGGDHVHVR